MCPLPIELYFQRQALRQEGSMDCGVPVFGALIDLSRQQILTIVPNAADGLTVDQWKQFLVQQGFVVQQYEQEQQYPLPCAHLVKGLHWVYQAKDGGIHDPSVVFESTSPHALTLDQAYGGRILTIAVNPVKGW